MAQTDSPSVPTQLSAPVGPGQPNRPADMALVRTLLNRFIQLKLLAGVVPVAADGGWDADVQRALQSVQTAFFFGAADPNGKLENGDTLFTFLQTADLAQKQIASTLSAETYQLAAVMVPGGADWTKRTVEKKTVVVNGKPQVQKTVTRQQVNGNIRTYLPAILTALTELQLNDTDMLMMALGTVRAESAGFAPIDEGISKYNTSPKGTAGRHAFDLYDWRDALGNEGNGDGALFKGRGFVQLTGRNNYETIGEQIGVDLVNDPDRANETTVAARILARFLKNQEAAIRNALAANNLALARKKVNGGSHGLSAFVQSFAAGRRYLGIVVRDKAKAKARLGVKSTPAVKAAVAQPPKPAPGGTAGSVARPAIQLLQP